MWNLEEFRLNIEQTVLAEAQRVHLVLLRDVDGVEPDVVVLRLVAQDQLQLRDDELLRQIAVLLILRGVVIGDRLGNGAGLDRTLRRELREIDLCHCRRKH